MNSNGRLLPDSTVPPTSRIATKEARQKQDCCPKLPTSRIAARSPQQAELRPKRLATSRIAARSSPQAELLPGAPHKQNYDQGGSPQAELLPGAPNKQNYDQGGSPQAELLPGARHKQSCCPEHPTSRITTKDARHKQNYDQGGSPLAALRSTRSLGSLPTLLYLNPIIVHAQGPGMHGTLTRPSKGYTIRPTDVLQWPDSPAK